MKIRTFICDHKKGIVEGCQMSENSETFPWLVCCEQTSIILD